MTHPVVAVPEKGVVRVGVIPPALKDSPPTSLFIIVYSFVRRLVLFTEDRCGTIHTISILFGYSCNKITFVQRVGD